jgi:hypothetical protein
MTAEHFSVEDRRATRPTAAWSMPGASNGASYAVCISKQGGFIF